MGAKQSKKSGPKKSPEPKNVANNYIFSNKETYQEIKPEIIEIQRRNILNIEDDEMFPDELAYQELKRVKEEFQPGQKFLVKEFGPGSEVMKWIENLDYEDAFFHGLDSLCSTDRSRYWYKHISLSLQAMGDTLLLAFIPTGHIVGFSILGNDPDDNDALRRYVTCSGPRGIGIGYELVKKIHEIARRRGKTLVRLAASNANAKRYHERQGYKSTGKNISREGEEMIYRIEGGRQTRKKKRSLNKTFHKKKR